MKLLKFVGVAAVVVPCSVGMGQTVTVNQSATANGTTVFNTIGAALDVEPDVIEITDSEVYEEVITISNPVQIVGTGLDRPILTLLPNPDGYVVYGENVINRGGIVIDLPDTLTTGSVKLHNLIILPQKAVPSPDRLRSAIENTNNNLYLELDNVLITANNGSDVPLSPDGMVSLVSTFQPSHNSPHTPFGANGIMLGRPARGGTPMFEGEGVELLIKDSIVTHFRNDYNASEPERWPKAVQMLNPYTDYSNPDPNIRRLVRVEGESKITHCRVGIELSGDLIMRSGGQRIIMMGHSTQALDFVGPAPNERTIENVNFTNMAANTIWDRGHGPVRWTMRHCSNFNTLNSIVIVSGAGVGSILIEDSTLVGGRYAATAGKAYTFDIRPGTSCDITIRNSILGGKQNHSLPPNPPNADLSAIRDFNVFRYAGVNDLTLEGAAFIGEGLYAFRASETGEFLGFEEGEDATRTGEPSTTSDPNFIHVNPSDPLNEMFLDVINSDYATASATNGPLGGGGDYVGVSTVSDWTLY